MLQSLHSTVNRIELLNYCAQGNLKPDIIEEKMQILKKKRDKEERTYTVSKHLNENPRIVSSVVCSVDHKDLAYFEITNGMLLAEDMRDVFEWFVSRKAPKAWRDAMAKTALSDMSEVEGGKEWFSPW